MKKQPHILGIIPARFQSMRFPGKPLVMIQGKSMLQRVYEQASKVSSFSKLVIATDDIRIIEHADTFGAPALMTSSSHQSGTDRCGEVINTLNEAFDIAVNIQGDEPFIQPNQIEIVIKLISNSEVQIATLIKQITGTAEEINSHLKNSNVVKVVTDLSGKALYFSRSPIPGKKQDEAFHAIYYKHIGLYAYKTETLKQLVNLNQTMLEKTESLEQLRWLSHGFHIHTAETEYESFGIDSPEDLENIAHFS